jgi:hypothetical protein
MYQGCAYRRPGPAGNKKDGDETVVHDSKSYLLPIVVPSSAPDAQCACYYTRTIQIIYGPTLAHPDYNWRLYLKTDWSNTAMAAVLCQIDPNDPKSIKAEQDYIEKGLACPFDNNRKTLPLRLQPVAFISRSTSKAETSFHSYVGEASAGRWVMGKWRKYLLGACFTWLADCSGLKRFFECNDHVSAHMLMHRHAEIFQFNFDFEHRPASMMTDCDTLNR